MSFPPMDPGPTAPDPGPTPPMFPRPIDDGPKEGDERQVPDKSNPQENPQPGPDMPPAQVPFPDHTPDP